MNIIIVASIVVVATLAVGAGLASLFVSASDMVAKNQKEIEQQNTGYNPALTFGHAIAVAADPQTQLEEAQILAAKRAAALPRGANVRIGRKGHGVNTKSARQGADTDPVTAVKIANFHGWQILATGAPKGQQQAAAAAPTQTAAPTKTAKDLVPGEDYEYIEITDDMAPAEKRKARIANSKAKSAAMKALKASGAQAAAPAAAAAAPAAASPAAAAPAAAGPAREPQPGVDYEVIEITDDMAPDEVRKARIANSKARSAAKKAFKAAGGAAATAPAAAQPQAPAQPAQAAPVPAAAAAIPKPDLIEISDDMPPDEVRRARIANAKANSAYKKALKAAGIDPSTVS